MLFFGVKNVALKTIKGVPINTILLSLINVEQLGQKINFIQDGNVQLLSTIDDPYRVMHSHGLSMRDVVNLCGGFPCEDINRLEIKISSPGKGVLAVQVNTDFYQVNRVIDFELKIINNSYMHVYEAKLGTGTRLFCNQVREARLKGFRKLYTTAMGKDGGREWGGYYCWGRLGYEMIIPDHQEFLVMMEQFGRAETSLHQLLTSEDGRIFWLNYGFGWSGQFWLDDSHRNISYLREYLINAGADYEI